MRALSEGAIEVGYPEPLTGQPTTGPVAHLLAEKIVEGLNLPAKDAHAYVKTMLEYSIGRPRTRSESDAVDNKQLPRMIFLHKPHDSLATPGEPNKPLRILGQVAGPNGEIVDFRTSKVVVPAPAKSVSGDDGLGEGQDRLELVEDLPPPCPTCDGCGRQGIGFGSQTEPCGDCGGAGRLR